MDIHDAQTLLVRLLDDAATQFQRVPGSAMLVRYIKSSYQNDPVRSAVELFLFLFALRYLLAPKYSTHRQKRKFVELAEHVGFFLTLGLGMRGKGEGEREWGEGRRWDKEKMVLRKEKSRWIGSRDQSC